MSDLLNVEHYSVPSESVRALDSLVDGIESNPGDLISPQEFDDEGLALGLKAVLAQLPADMSEDDFVGILRLALLTESATESYASLITERARRFDAHWLARFTERVWAPDELTHHTPYRLMLLSLGFSEGQLDREIREAQEKQYVHPGGDTPVHLTTFGMIQEYLTDNYHGLIGRLLRQASPRAAHMAFRIKRRETLHMAWYRDMTALQVEASPGFVAFVANEIDRFHMPGTSLVPELQAQGLRWQALMGGDFNQIFKDLFRLVHETLGDVRLTGELVMVLAARKNVKLGPLSARQIATALNRLGGPGYGLLGEALLENAGLSYLFKRPQGRQDSAYGLFCGVQEGIRTLLKSWIIAHIPPPSTVVLRA